MRNMGYTPPNVVESFIEQHFQILIFFGVNNSKWPYVILQMGLKSLETENLDPPLANLQIVKFLNAKIRACFAVSIGFLD